jgi:hypothetical protein
VTRTLTYLPHPPPPPGQDPTKISAYFEADAAHGQLEQVSILSTVNRGKLGTNELHTVLLQNAALQAASVCVCVCESHVRAHVHVPVGGFVP